MSDGWEVIEEKKLGDWEVAETTSMPISAITGKPEPTSAERIMQSNRAVTQMFPVAGDIIGTAIMPQIGVPLKAGRLAGMGIKTVNALLRGAGAGAGSVYGELERQVATEQFDPEQIKLQGVLGAVGEPALSLAGAGLKAAAKPAYEIMSDLTIAGGKTKQILTQRLQQQAQKRADDFIYTVAPQGVKTKIEDVGFEKALSEAYDEKTVMYNHFKDSLQTVADNNKGYVPLQKTQQSLMSRYNEIADPTMVAAGKIDRKAEAEIIKSFGLKGSDDVHITVRRLMRGEDLTPAEINHLQANIFPSSTKKYQEMLPTKIEKRKDLKSILMEDLDALGVAQGKASADAVHRELKQFEQLRNIYEKNGAKTKSPDTGEAIFHPARFVENARRAERNLRKYQPELWEKLQKEVEFYETVADTLKRGQRNLGGMAMLAGSASAGYLTGGWPVAEAFGAASAWALMSETGRKTVEGIIRAGINKPVAKTLLHLGGQTVNLQQAHK